MTIHPNNLQYLIDQAAALPALRVAVVDASQPVVIETLREAQSLGIVEPWLVGEPGAICAACARLGWDPGERIVAAPDDAEAAARAVAMARAGTVDAIMKGDIHTDLLMHALLDSAHGLRLPGRRVSHVFVVDVATYPKLFGITDAAINISPDLNAKAQILQNAIDLFHLLGVEQPKVAVLSAIETVNPAVLSSVDAACLTLMARRGQINGALVDGPLAFDNAISLRAARAKGIDSPVAGDADILLLPDFVSGNILAKDLEYLANAVVAGIALGLAVPVVLTSRADPGPARLASLAIAALIHHRGAKDPTRIRPTEARLPSAPQPECACCPVPSTAEGRQKLSNLRPGT